jgi:hypothetical protein
VHGSDAVTGTHDPAFDSIPFASWMAGPDSPTKIHWSARVLPAQLSFHQRLLTAVSAQVDGADLASRRGKGEFVVFAQFTDSAGVTYQDHTSIDLTKVEEALTASNVTYSVRAYVRPGEYRVAILLFDSATKEHWAKTEKITIVPLRHDAFPDSWNDLAAVESVPSVDAPEAWLEPASAARLNLPAKTKTPARIDVIVNLSPSEQHAGSERLRNQTLSALIPTLQVISEMQLGESALNVALLDIARHRVVFHQSKVHDLQWDNLKDAFAEDATGTIDVKSLQDRGRNAAFFVKEVSRRISADTPSGARHALIVLSGATEFAPGEDLRPIEATRPADCPVFYIRYYAPVPRREPVYAGRRGGFGRGMGGVRSGMEGPAGQMHAERSDTVDQLEKTLKPVSPRLFDVSTPEEMRKALAEIRDQIESL